MSSALVHFDAAGRTGLADQLKQELADRLLNVYEEGLQLGVDVRANHVLSVLETLRTSPELAFTTFVDLTVVDYSKFVKAQPERFGVIYILMSPKLGLRVKVRAFVPDSLAQAPSVTSLWEGAAWGEREAYDLFGIRFDGHANLKRILMPDAFRDHPLRKEYPLRGRGERADFEVYRAFVGGAAEPGQ